MLVLFHWENLAAIKRYGLRAHNSIGFWFEVSRHWICIPLSPQAQPHKLGFKSMDLPLLSIPSLFAWLRLDVLNNQSDGPGLLFEYQIDYRDYLSAFIFLVKFYGWVFP